MNSNDTELRTLSTYFPVEATPTTLSDRLFNVAQQANLSMDMTTVKALMNTSYIHQLHSVFYNDSLYYLNCPSKQNPVGNLISMILYAIVCVVGLFGNTLVIYCVLRFSKLQTVTNMYILNLAIADQCFLIGIPFLITTIHLNEWIFGSIVCKAYMVSTSITQFTSSIFLLIMSADRYIAVCHPISSPKFRTPFVSKMISGIAWLTSFFLMLPVLAFANTFDRLSTNRKSCNIIWPHDQNGTTFTMYSLVLGFAIPLCLILIFYYLVLKKLRNVGPKNKSKEKKRSHRKVTKLVLTVVTVYVLCWLPYWISQLALINSPPEVCKSKLEITIFVLVGCLGYSNSAMNPILYAFLSDNFKKSFLKACTCTKSKDINAQLNYENSFLTKFGRNRGSERLASTSRPPTRTIVAGIESAVVIDEQNNNGTVTTIKISNNNHNTTNGSNNQQQPQQQQQRPPVLHTDL